jgi:hypothetical protein
LDVDNLHQNIQSLFSKFFPKSPNKCLQQEFYEEFGEMVAHEFKVSMIGELSYFLEFKSSK